MTYINGSPITARLYDNYEVTEWPILIIPAIVKEAFLWTFRLSDMIKREVGIWLSNEYVFQDADYVDGTNGPNDKAKQ